MAEKELYLVDDSEEIMAYTAGSYSKTLVRLKDGTFCLAYLKRKAGGAHPCLWYAESSDRGKTWPLKLELASYEPTEEEPGRRGIGNPGLVTDSLGNLIVFFELKDVSVAKHEVGFIVRTPDGVWGPTTGVSITIVRPSDGKRFNVVGLSEPVVAVGRGGYLWVGVKGSCSSVGLSSGALFVNRAVVASGQLEWLQSNWQIASYYKWNEALTWIEEQHYVLEVAAAVTDDGKPVFSYAWNTGACFPFAVADKRQGGWTQSDLEMGYSSIPYNHYCVPSGLSVRLNDIAAYPGTNGYVVVGNIVGGEGVSTVLRLYSVGCPAPHGWIPEDVYNAFNVKVFVDKRGHVHILWTDLVGGEAGLWHKEWSPTEGWFPKQLLSLLGAGGVKISTGIAQMWPSWSCSYAGCVTAFTRLDSANGGSKYNLYCCLKKFQEVPWAEGYKIWGINIVLSSQKEAREWLNYVLGFVNTILTLSPDGKVGIRPLKDTDAATVTIQQEDFKEFTLQRPFWGEIPNDYRANFVDKERDFTVRTIAMKNPAILAQGALQREKTIDLTAYLDLNIAWARLWRIVRQDSFPRAYVSGRLSREYSMLMPGDIVRVKYPDYGVDCDFRIIKIVDPDPSENYIEIEAVQHGQQALGPITAGTEQTKEAEAGKAPSRPELPGGELKLEPLLYVRAYELPYEEGLPEAVNILLLASKQTGAELGFSVYISSQPYDFHYLGKVTRFAVAGTLQQDYPEDTNEIDDEVGLLFKPYKDWTQFDNVSRTDLFVPNRFVLIDDEIMAFQTYEPEGEDSYRLKGVIRGYRRTERQSHTAGATVYVFQLKDQLITINRSSTFYLKCVPYSAGGSEWLEGALLIQVDPQLKAFKPPRIGRVVATRSGTQVEVKCAPKVRKVRAGAGMLAENNCVCQFPPQFVGDLYYKVASNAWQNNGNSCTFTVNQAGSFILKVKLLEGNFFSEETELTVGASDGQYITNVS